MSVGSPRCIQMHLISVDALIERLIIRVHHIGWFNMYHFTAQGREGCVTPEGGRYNGDIRRIVVRETLMTLANFYIDVTLFIKSAES